MAQAQEGPTAGEVSLRTGAVRLDGAHEVLERIVITALPVAVPALMQLTEAVRLLGNQDISGGSGGGQGQTGQHDKKRDAQGSPASRPSRGRKLPTKRQGQRPRVLRAGLRIEGQAAFDDSGRGGVHAGI